MKINGKQLLALENFFRMDEHREKYYEMLNDTKRFIAGDKQFVKKVLEYLCYPSDKVKEEIEKDIFEFDRANYPELKVHDYHYLLDKLKYCDDYVVIDTHGWKDVSEEFNKEPQIMEMIHSDQHIIEAALWELIDNILPEFGL